MVVPMTIYWFIRIENRIKFMTYFLTPSHSSWLLFQSLFLSLFIHSFQTSVAVSDHPAAVIKRLIRMHVKEWCTKPCVLGSLGLILAGFGTLFIFFWEDIFQTQLSNVSIHPPLTRSPSKPTRLDRLGITSTIPSRSSPPIWCWPGKVFVTNFMAIWWSKWEHIYYYCDDQWRITSNKQNGAIYYLVAVLWREKGDL